jgi:hypothetical protein
MIVAEPTSSRSDNHSNSQQPAASSQQKAESSRPSSHRQAYLVPAPTLTHNAPTSYILISPLDHLCMRLKRTLSPSHHTCRRLNTHKEPAWTTVERLDALDQVWFTGRVGEWGNMRWDASCVTVHFAMGIRRWKKQG